MIILATCCLQCEERNGQLDSTGLPQVPWGMGKVVQVGRSSVLGPGGLVEIGKQQVQSVQEDTQTYLVFRIGHGEDRRA